MATSKTLTPTNVTIQIPEFTDQPDQRVNSNCIDKLGDAVNALNSKISDIFLYTSVNNSDGTKAKLKTAIENILSNYTLEESRSYPVMFIFAGSNSVGSYTGTINVTSGGIRFMIGQEDRILHGLYLRSSGTISNAKQLVGTEL